MTSAIGSYATPTALKSRLGITEVTYDSLLGTFCDQVNQYIETKTGRVLAPITSAVYYYDGDGSDSLYLPRPASGPPIGGLRAITTLDLAYYTGSAYVSTPTTEVFLRQQVGMTGPYERLAFTDFPRAGFTYFPRGYNTVKVTATAGWAAIPDEVTDVALTAAGRAWYARQSGQQDIVGTDEHGVALVSRFFSPKDLGVLRTYSLAESLA